MPKQSVHKPAVPKDVVRRAGIIEANSTPLLRTTTEVQNPSELAARIVSFHTEPIEITVWIAQVVLKKADDYLRRW